MWIEGEERDNVEDDVAAIFKDLEAGGNGDLPEQDDKSGGADGAQAGETPAQAAQRKIDDAGRVRDEKGKFAPKGQDPAQGAAAAAGAKPDAKGGAPAQGAAQGAQGAQGDPNQPLQPPSHWSPQAKADFVNAPRSIQEQALKREREIAEASKEWQGKAEEYNRLNRVIGPNVDRWTRQGRTPDAAIGQLVAFERALETNPVTAIAEILRVFTPQNELAVIDQIAQANGLKLVRADNQGEGAQGGGSPAQLDPTVAALTQQVRGLTAFINSIQQQGVQSGQKALLDEVAAFQADPEHIYFENVRAMVGAIVTAGDEKGDNRPPKVRLKEAYEQACWADPTVRQLLIQDQQRKAADAERARVAAARNAGGSIAGHPEQGQHVQAGRKPIRDSVEDDARAAFLELQGQ